MGGLPKRAASNLLIASNRLDETRWLVNLMNRRYNIPTKVLGTIPLTYTFNKSKTWLVGCVDSARLPTVERVCMVIIYGRVWINRVRLPILLMAS